MRRRMKKNHWKFFVSHFFQKNFPQQIDFITYFLKWRPNASKSIEFY